MCVLYVDHYCIVIMIFWFHLKSVRINISFIWQARPTDVGCNYNPWEILSVQLITNLSLVITYSVCPSWAGTLNEGQHFVRPPIPIVTPYKGLTHLVRQCIIAHGSYCGCMGPCLIQYNMSPWPQYQTALPGQWQPLWTALGSASAYNCLFPLSFLKQMKNYSAAHFTPDEPMNK